jgi:ferredoxin-thioredoxin reductase catalytic subunit
MDKKTLLENSRAWAERMNVSLNPDSEKVDEILGKLLENQRKHGFRLCPCRRPSADKTKNRLVTCPCAYAMGEIELQGHCLCLLYTAKQ